MYTRFRLGSGHEGPYSCRVRVRVRVRVSVSVRVRVGVAARGS
jgi:hypothetical protein